MNTAHFTVRVCVWCGARQGELTLGLLALPGGPPPDAGAMLVQVEEAHQAFGAVL